MIYSIQIVSEKAFSHYKHNFPSELFRNLLICLQPSKQLETEMVL